MSSGSDKDTVFAMVVYLRPGMHLKILIIASLFCQSRWSYSLEW